MSENSAGEQLLSLTVGDNYMVTEIYQDRVLSAVDFSNSQAHRTDPTKLTKIHIGRWNTEQCRRHEARSTVYSAF